MFSTVVGGSEDEEGLAITTGSVGSVYFGGSSTSTSLPGTETLDCASNGTGGFVIRIRRDEDVFSPEWGTFVGGAQNDEVRGLSSARYLNDEHELFIGGTASSNPLLRLPMTSLRGGKRSHSGGQDMFVITLDARDFTPPTGMVLDGIQGDEDVIDFKDTLPASWTLDERETRIGEYLVAVGTAPGCADLRPFKSVGKAKTITMSPAHREIGPLAGGQCPTSIPDPPPEGTPCPEGTDGGADGGTDGGQVGTKSSAGDARLRGGGRLRPFCLCAGFPHQEQEFPINWELTPSLFYAGVVPRRAGRDRRAGWT